MCTVAVSFSPDVARDFIETDAKIFWAQLELENQEQKKSFVELDEKISS